MPRVRDGAPELQAEIAMRVPPDKAVLVRARKDGKPIRISFHNPYHDGLFVNPLTETADLVDTSIHTIDQCFRDIETTYYGRRVPVDLIAVMQVRYLVRETVTLETADRLSRTPRSVLLGEIITAVYARLREACASWGPEELRAGHAEPVEWARREAARDLAPRGLGLLSLVVKEITDEHHFFDTIDVRNVLAVKRDILRKEGIDSGPEPPVLRTPEEIGAEYVRVKALWGILEARRATERATDGNGQ